MSAEELRPRADLPWLVRPVGPLPPDMPVGALPQRPADPPAVILPLEERQAAILHELAALGADGSIAGHVDTLTERPLRPEAMGAAV